ncbi:BREX-1 system phosphatase PglZ type A [Companilactobacillus kimchiensis]|uniref:Uncharacterized protein n=1 Tax=Companilactobacillus kimchiensis TaxID=993692 RepID=A0A0R2LDK1_9LACO|nr:BREX-1 system phosphatase PglZ type A [Companilactobacillus kimchiensis]KRN97974.1 hypothetical protein IV57_GL001380 [Companilactobacillus kimchiensis]
MADVSNNRIIDSLKRKFKNGSRFVFWYDNDAEFTDELNDIDDSLSGIAQVIILKKGEQLKTKMKLLSAPEDEKILVYSPERQPVLERNHLRDMVLYSDTFTADAQEMIRQDLSLPEKLNPFVKNYAKFFASKERRNKFARYDVESFIDTPDMAILATIVNSNQRVVNFFDILRIILCEDIHDNKYLTEFAKYDILDDFWELIRKIFNYDEKQPSLIKLAASLFLTETFHQMGLDVPKRVANYDLSDKYSNASTFVNQFSNFNFVDGDKFENLADEVWGLVDGNTLFKNIKPDDLAKSDVFGIFDRRILLWEQRRLLLGDFDNRLNNMTFPELVNQRIELHYGSKYKVVYNMILSAWKLLSSIGRKLANNTETMINDYIQSGYLIDTYYREFILSYQSSGMIEQFIETKKLVESSYSKDYLDDYNFSWTDQLRYNRLPSRHLQRNFYKNYIEPEQNRIVVIISDAFRFEAAKELQKNLSMDDQITAQKMDYLISGLPSVTYMGMPSLLPNDNLELVDKKLLVDDKEAIDIKTREKILVNRNANSAAYWLDSLKGASSKEIKQLFAGKEVVYIYHNHIDAIADDPKTEDGVFKATQEAIKEIQDLIARLRTQSISQFYVTADHGYIYRNENLTDTDKISEDVNANDLKSQRYIVSEKVIDEPGISKQLMGDVLDNDDQRFVYYPQTSNVFRAAGSVNYVHGGASLQEMIVPLLNIKATSSKSKAEDVQLQLVSSNRNITSLEVPIRLLQAAPISSTVRPVMYEVYFVDDNKELISAKISVNANLKVDKVEGRIIDLSINLIDKNYDKSKKYNLVIKNTNTGEISKATYNMDIASFGDFDF